MCSSLGAPAALPPPPLSEHAGGAPAALKGAGAVSGAPFQRPPSRWLPLTGRAREPMEPWLAVPRCVRSDPPVLRPLAGVRAETGIGLACPLGLRIGLGLAELLSTTGLLLARPTASCHSCCCRSIACCSCATEGGAGTGITTKSPTATGGCIYAGDLLRARSRVRLKRQSPLRGQNSRGVKETAHSSLFCAAPLEVWSEGSGPLTSTMSAPPLPSNAAAERKRPHKLTQTRVLDAKYQLGEELGRGASGRVYRAFNRETGEFCAIKEIAIKDMPESGLRSVQSEIELLHTLQHERIVRCYETVRTSDHLYIVLELMGNGSLASIVKKFGRFPEQLVATYTRQVLEGLEHLHSHGVCHRDIKGANVLIAREGEVKLADLKPQP